MRPSSSILVVEDDPAQREMLAGFLRDLEFSVVESEDGREALDRLEKGHFDLVVADLRLPGLTGIELLAATKALNPEIEFVLATAYGSVRGAVESLKGGAADYLLKPLDLDEVEHVVSRCLEARQLRRENRDLKRRLGEVETIEGIVTAGGEMARALSEVARVAPSRVSVLLQGESGTGKELLARAIHAASPRRDGPFVAVSAAALSPTLLESELFGHERGAFTGADRPHVGRFERASGGTLFLDEIGDLPAAVQVKLLRALQEREIERVGGREPIGVDVRVVAATHQDLPVRIAEGTYREDLYYRLAVVSIAIPPLRERRADIPLLVSHFITKHAGLVVEPPTAISRNALDLLVRYHYPGNVRELENLVQRALVLARGATIEEHDLPFVVSGRPPRRPVASHLSLPDQVALLELTAIEEALRAEAGHQTRAAERLGISERALRYKLSKIRHEEPHRREPS